MLFRSTQDGAIVDITAIGEALVIPLLPVAVNQNDTPEFAANQLVLELD